MSENEPQNPERETEAIALRPAQAVGPAMSVSELLSQVRLIQTVMKEVMREGEHFGTIPGCGDKPALRKSGAEKLGMTFHLAPTFDVKRFDLPAQHREYEVICTLNGRFQGVGSCSTMEGKYRYRTGSKKSTGKPVPKAYWAIRESDPAKAQALLGGKGFGTMKEDNNWVICEQGERCEHDNPADYYNTVLKMAKKRAHVDAILTATAASDIFTQDIDEGAETPSDAPGAAPVTVSRPAAQSAPGAPARRAAAGKLASGPEPAKSGCTDKAPELYLPNVNDEQERLTRFLAGCSAAARGDTALIKEWAVEEGHILPTEDLDDFPAGKLPKTAGQARAIFASLSDVAAQRASHAPTGPAQPEDKDRPPVESAPSMDGNDDPIDPPVDDHDDGPGTSVLDGTLRAITCRPTAKGGRRWGLLIIPDDNPKGAGVWVNTFDATDGALAEKLKGKSVSVEYTEDRYGKQLVKGSIQV